MSKRVWEGINRHEYEFNELPKAVRDREMDRLQEKERSRLGEPKIPGTFFALESDRNDFLSAYDSGNRREAANILNQKSHLPGSGIQEGSPAPANELARESGAKKQPEMAPEAANAKSLKLANLQLSETESVVKPVLPAPASPSGRNFS